MTVPLSMRSAVLVLTMALLQLAGCGTTSDDLSGKSAEKLYAEAKENMDSGVYEQAIKGFERVEGLAAGTLLGQQSQLNVAYLYWKTGEKAQALSSIERFIKVNPSSPALDYAFYLRGVINFNEDLGLFGNFSGQDLSERDQRAARDAYAAFKQLVDQFPTSPYADDARKRMNYIVNSLASYELHVARYYFRRGAYVAAANRAQQAVTEFQQSPSAEEALYLLMQCYDQLQLTDLRDDAERVLRQNYPDSAFFTRGIDSRAKPWWRLW